jgi:ATP-dependent DNA helicase RecQ
MPTLEAVLRETWGYESFRPLQAEAMAAILAGRDSLVVLPTGGGKSVCFQAPALVRPGLGVVVSPLIALMKDQVDSLRESGVEAAFFNSSLDAGAREDVLSGLRAQRYRLLYVAPERLVGDGGEWFRRLLAAAGLRFLAIDEAHCISQWGHDFRPEYRGLGKLRSSLPAGVSMHAFTATATPRVRTDIVEQLGLADPEILIGLFDRPNLVYRVRRRTELKRQLLGALDRHRGEAGILYCLRRREVEELAEFLRGEGIAALPYHAGLEDHVRAQNQEAFAEERADVIVATVAFGMGIDRSNVRYVLHAGAPRSLEHYQQEAGRAGRDGLEAECLLWYSTADFLLWRRLLESSGELRDESVTQLRQMERYAQTTGCRHRSLCEHFGERFPATTCGACDRCLGELELTAEPRVVAQKILSCVLRVGESFGAGHVTDVLRGRATDKVAERGHQRLSTFGLLRDAPTDEVRGYIEQLTEQGFLAVAGERYPVLHTTPAGALLLKGEADCQLTRQPRPEPRRGNTTAPAKGKADAGWAGVDRELFEALRGLRTAIARERKVPPYVIFHDTTLRELARLRPHSRAQLLAVHGVGARKAEEFGQRMLATIAAHATVSGS